MSIFMKQSIQIDIKRGKYQNDSKDAQRRALNNFSLLTFRLWLSSLLTFLFSNVYIIFHIYIFTYYPSSHKSNISHYFTIASAILYVEKTRIFCFSFVRQVITSFSSNKFVGMIFQQIFFSSYLRTNQRDI